MIETTLLEGVNRITLGLAAPTLNTQGIANENTLNGVFLYTRLPVRIWGMNSSNVWSEITTLTGAAGSRMRTVILDSTEVTRVFYQSTGADNVVIRLLRRNSIHQNSPGEVVSVPGPAGPAGATGPTGPAGAAGAAGATGSTGPAGAPFEIVKTYNSLDLLLAGDIDDGKFAIVGGTLPTTDVDYGKLYLRDNDAWTYVTDMSVQGTQGVTGATGIQGPAGPQGSAGPAGSDGAQGPAGGLTIPKHTHTGSLVVDIPGANTTWNVKPSKYYKSDYANLSPSQRNAYTNAGNTGKIEVTTNTLASNVPISVINVGGHDYAGPSNSNGYHSTYVTDPNSGWAPLHDIGEADPRFTVRMNGGQVGFTSWQSNLEMFQKSMPRFYTYGPMGAGPTGAKMEITGSLLLDPRSNIFIGNPLGTGLQKYPEEWTTGDDDGLLITRNMFVNNSNDTYYRFGDKRSLVTFASQSYIDYKNSEINLDTLAGGKLTFLKAHDVFPGQTDTHTLLDAAGKVHLPFSSSLPEIVTHRGLKLVRPFNADAMGVQTDWLQVYPDVGGNGNKFQVAVNSTFDGQNVKFHTKYNGNIAPNPDEASSVLFTHKPSLGESTGATALFQKHVDINRLHLGKGISYNEASGYLRAFGSTQPAGTNSPLMIRQPGNGFGHGVLIECPYAGANTQGWGMRVDSTKELVFQAFQLDGNGDLVDNTWNSPGFGRGYLTDGTDVGQITFTGQHRSLPDVGTVSDFEDKVGLIVVSTGKYGSMGQEDISINDAMPKVALCSQSNDKRAYGVVSNVEDTDSDERRFTLGLWGSAMEKAEGDDRVIINSVGEGAMWITNINGNIENGDYITSSEVPGYGMRQGDDLLHNYTVAKITMDCGFDLNSSDYQCEEIEHNGQTYRRAFVGVTYHCG